MKLSKSDFKIASTCCKKLIYKKSGYETLNDENEYIEMLAQGGHIVGKYAQLMYPEGILIYKSSIEETIKISAEAISSHDKITLFEATFSCNNRIVRVDILEKEGQVLNIIEVKSKSHDSDDFDTDAKKRLTEHIEDVAFQTIVLKEAYPEYEIHSYLLLPDKSKRTKIEGLAGWFNVNKLVEENFEIDELPAQSNIRFNKPVVEFTFENDPKREEYLQNLRNDCLLTLVNVDEDVKRVKDEILVRSELHISIVENGIKPENFRINKTCKACEYNLGTTVISNGYRECWKELTDVNPHIFDLFYGGSIGHYKTGWYLDELIDRKKVAFKDLDPARFRNKQGELTSRGQRQLIQYDNTLKNSEWISPNMKNELSQLKYPLHFIDFESYTGAIPFHKGMRPYELIAFQWSCHSIEKPGDSPIHSYYLNDEYSFPNFRFAESLMQQIGSDGTPLMWTSFENTVLRNVLEQMDIYGHTNAELRRWLTNMTTDKEKTRIGRFVDQNDITLQNYFHPDMKGKTSIKKVLPAIWNNNSYLHAISPFKKYASQDGSTLNPYDNLSPVIDELEKEELVNDGTGAMRAYNELMFGETASDTKRRGELRNLLLQYCELDTMAMVIIWKYWMDKCGLNSFK